MNRSSGRLAAALSLALLATAASLAAGEAAGEGGGSSDAGDGRSPDLVTPRGLERTIFQESAPRQPAYDLRTDAVMVYGLGRDLAGRLAQWRRSGAIPHVMTGVAWGSYQDYLDGTADGREHRDEAQVDAAGRPIMHGGGVPYMVPSIAFSAYLERGIRRAIDAGAVAIHLEEPEFWARAGYSEAFRREWRIFYGEPWRRPDSSCDAQYRAGKLKAYLYRRTLDRLCAAMKEHSLTRHGRVARFYVPTHSLLNYTRWRIVSPEASLIDVPSIDGFVAQVWTGTARTPSTYRGERRERTFMTAFLEYGVMQELVRGTGKRMWFLADPVEDNPRHDWDDYRRNYVRTLAAALLHPEVSRYEVCPWPRRVFLGRFPAGSAGARAIPPAYAAVLAVLFNQLRDMARATALDVSWPDTTTGVGVFLADSAMFQRAGPAFTDGVAARGDDPERPTAREVRDLASFDGLALPLLVRGIPVRPVQLDNVARFPGYLDPCRVLLLSYEFLKPSRPGIHQELAAWVRAGGVLIYAGADTDPFHRVSEWWNRAARRYASPAEHLLETIGLPRRARGEHRVGRGRVIVVRRHPAYFSRSAAVAAELVGLVRRGLEARGERLIERNHFLVRRGPYVIAACLEESISAEPIRLSGHFVDLLDPGLAPRASVTIAPGEQAILIDLDRVRGRLPLVLASGGRIESWYAGKSSCTYTTTSIGGVEVATRILMPARPGSVTIGGKPATPDRIEWHQPSRTILLRHDGAPDPLTVTIRWGE